MYRPSRLDVTLARLPIDPRLAGRTAGTGNAGPSVVSNQRDMRFIAATLSGLVLAACQPNSVPVSLPVIPEERSELTSDDAAVIHARSTS
jgi:hypothetical protein